MGAALPLVVPVRQALESRPLADVAEAVREALGPILAGKFPQHGLVGITVGSRGVHGYAEILRAVGQTVAACSGRPICIPAMGSHAGGTAAGRREHLARLGISESTIGYPIVDGDPVLLGATDGGVSVFAAAPATRCDALVVVNRVKPHSNLSAPLGSGLRKMLAVGLGGSTGAEALHKAGLATHLADAAKVAAGRLKAVLGLALLEDGTGACARVEGVPAADFERVEPTLLAEADKALPRLPFAALDALFVRRMGKEYSGVGLDPNVIGRARRLGTAEAPNDPIRIGKIAVGELTAATAGNALGVGMVDVVTERFRKAINVEVTALNAKTAAFAHGDRVAKVVGNDTAALEALCEGLAPDAIRLAVIGDTATLATFLVSPACAKDLAAHATCKVEGEPRPLAFDADGNLTEP